MTEEYILVVTMDEAVANQAQTIEERLRRQLHLAIETIDRMTLELQEEHGRYLQLMARHTALAAAGRDYLADPHSAVRGRLEFLLLGAPK